MQATYPPTDETRVEALVKPIREWESSKPAKGKTEGEQTTTEAGATPMRRPLVSSQRACG